MRPVVDWALAGRTGARLARPGPATTRAEADAVVAELAASAVAAEGPVREVSLLADGLAVPAARVVDRPRWAVAAATSMGVLTGTTPTPGGPGPGVTGRAAGVQAGALLGYLSGAVLGQFDPFTPSGPGVGTLLLVAPNVVAVERALGVDPHDFRLWVCLHEVTHRVQFTAVPWLAGYMSDAVATLADPGEGDGDADGGGQLGRVLSLARTGALAGGTVGLLRALQSPAQQDALDSLLALGTLLEGHADHVMDAVGPAVVGSVRQIRAGFDRRRARPGNPVQRVLRALLGVDAKLAQYVRGKAFVDQVVAQVGMAAFTTVFASPQTLPVDAEIAEPARWVARVLG